MSAPMMPVFVSHYTVRTPYQDIVQKLIKSLKKFKLDYEIEAIETLGSWRLNSNYCAKQVLNMLRKHHPRPILRLDADAIVQREPKLFLDPKFVDKTDVGACMWYRFRRGGELLGGTLYFNNTPNALEVAERWVEHCELTPMKRNPDLLEKTLHEKRKVVRFTKMPLEYCKIFDFMRKNVPCPVIEHFQASRKNKHKINKMGLLGRSSC